MILEIQAKYDLACGENALLVQLVTKNVEKKLIEDIIVIIKFFKSFYGWPSKIFPCPGDRI